jgi:hypothetical protein
MIYFFYFLYTKNMKKIIILLGGMFSVLGLSLLLSFPVHADTICSQQYAPVCGVNGVTYNNSCEAGTTPIAYTGSCEGSTFNQDVRPFTLTLKWGYLTKTPGGALTNFDGYFNLSDGGKVFVEKTFLDSTDKVLPQNNDYSGVDWTSSVTTGADGLKLRIYPASLTEQAKIRIGDFTQTYSMSALKNINVTQNIDTAGHQVDMKSLGVEPFFPMMLYMNWGKLPRFNPVFNDTTKEWQGSVSLSNGTADLVRKIGFEGKDIITPDILSNCVFAITGSGTVLSGTGSLVSGCASAQTISFDTYTGNHFDGILVYVPNDVNTVTIKLGDVVNTTYTIDELRHLNVAKQVDNTGNGYVLKNIMLHPYELLSNVFDRKARIIEKLMSLEDKLYQLKTLFGVDIGNVVGFMNMFMDYTLPKDLYLEFENKLIALRTTFNSTDLTKDTLVTTLKELGTYFTNLKNRAALLKFNQNLIAFKDVDDGEWYTGFVQMMKDKNIISGYKDPAGKSLGIFVPANNVTFGEILKIVLNAAGMGENSSLWNDPAVLAQDAGTWKTNWAARFYQIALYKNYRILTDDNFALTLPITRGQVIGLIMDVFGVDTTGSLSNCFSDVPSDYKYARDICKAKDLGIISGNPDGTFRSDKPVNRAEIAKIISNVLASL